MNTIVVNNFHLHLPHHLQLMKQSYVRQSKREQPTLLKGEFYAIFYDIAITSQFVHFFVFEVSILHLSFVSILQRDRVFSGVHLWWMLCCSIFSDSVVALIFSGVQTRWPSTI